MKRQAEWEGSRNSKTTDRLSGDTVGSHCRPRHRESVPHITLRRSPRVWSVPPADTRYSTAARALVGKSYAPSTPPHPAQVRGRRSRKLAGNRRGAPLCCSRAAPARGRQGAEGGEGIEPDAWLSFGRGARGRKACAQLSTWLTLPEGQYRTLMPRGPSLVVLHLAAACETSRPSPSSSTSSS
jgi:hypothetical protein